MRAGDRLRACEVGQCVLETIWSPCSQKAPSWSGLKHVWAPVNAGPVLAGASSVPRPQAQWVWAAVRAERCLGGLGLGSAREP